MNNNVVKGLLGCSGILAIVIIFLGLLKLLFGDFAMMYGLMLLMIIVAILAKIIDGLAKAGKWVGLGAILGNVFNNKINADAAIKSGKIFKKQKIETKNSVVNNIVDFVSPTMEDDKTTKSVEDSNFIGE
ncbi:MAG: transcriptional regulator, partial [Streptococcus gallolyticus]